MAKKKRRFQQVEVDDQKNTPQYEDKFQRTLGRGIEGLERGVAGRGRTLAYIVGGLVVVALIAGAYFWYSRSVNNKAQAALGKAVMIMQSQVAETPPVGSTEKTYKSEKERADAAIAAFQSVVDTYGGSVGEKARYFIAVNKLSTDRAAAIGDLENISNGSSETAKLAKFALAQTRFDDGRYDDAAKIYQDLLAMPDPVIAKETLNFELAKVYEKQNKTKEAADIYFNIAKAASEAKDPDGQPLPQTETSRQAKAKLAELAPDRAKEISEPAPSDPFGGGM